MVGAELVASNLGNTMQAAAHLTFDNNVLLSVGLYIDDLDIKLFTEIPETRGAVPHDFPAGFSVQHLSKPDSLRIGFQRKDSHIVAEAKITLDNGRVEVLELGRIPESQEMRTARAALSLYTSGIRPLMQTKVTFFPYCLYTVTPGFTAPHALVFRHDKLPKNGTEKVVSKPPGFIHQYRGASLSARRLRSAARPRRA